MFNPNWIPLLVVLNVSYCGAPGAGFGSGGWNGGSSTSGSSSSSISCGDYSLMLNVEADAGGTCTWDMECGQVLTGTGVGCETDDRIANNTTDVTWFFDMLEEAEAAGCSIDFGTTGECNPYATPVCRYGQCGWQ